MALRYVAYPLVLSATYIVVSLPTDTENAYRCSHDMDAALSVASFTADIRPANLTRRELEIARWVSEGKTSPEVAIILSLSEYTVNDYIRSGMKKMGAKIGLASLRKRYARDWLPKNLDGCAETIRFLDSACPPKKSVSVPTRLKDRFCACADGQQA